MIHRWTSIGNWSNWIGSPIWTIVLNLKTIRTLFVIRSVTSVRIITLRMVTPRGLCEYDAQIGPDTSWAKQKRFYSAFVPTQAFTECSRPNSLKIVERSPERHHKNLMIIFDSLLVNKKKVVWNARRAVNWIVSADVSVRLIFGSIVMIDAF